MKFKRLFLAFLLLAMPLCPVGWTGMTCSKNNQAAYQTIGSAEQAVLTANAAYLDKVVSGQVSTNDTLRIEQAFNDTQLALHTAASLASGGTNSPVPLTASVKVQNFTNTVNSAK